MENIEQGTKGESVENEHSAPCHGGSLGETESHCAQVEVKSPKKGVSNFPTVGDIFIIFGVMMLIRFVVGLLSGIFEVVPAMGDVSALNEAEEYDIRYAIGRSSMWVYGVMMFVSSIFVVVYRWCRGGRGRIARVFGRGNIAFMTLWGVMMIFSLSVVLEPVFVRMPSVPEYTGRGWGAIVSLVVLAPIFEEFICRGVLLESIRRRAGAIVALLVSSLFFAMLHIHPVVALNAFVVGIVLGYVYIRSESLLASIVLHAINNAMAYLLLYVNSSNLYLSDLILNENLYKAIYYTALLVLIISVTKMVYSLLRIERRDKIMAS